MKVLQINSVCGYGSTGRIVTDLYKTLNENGHDCVIAYGRGTAPNGIKTIKIGNKMDIYLHAILSKLFDKHGYGSKKATKKLIKDIEIYNPDIIHLHNIHGYYINLEILFNYLEKNNKTVIWTLHDCWSFTGHCAHFDYIQCTKWKNQCKKCPQKRSYPNSMFIDNSKKNFYLKHKLFTNINNLTMVTPSKWLAKLVKESFLNKYNVEVIYNGIDLDVFKPTPSEFKREYNLENKKVILGVASNWKLRKGLDTFGKLAQELDDSYKIILIGINKNDRKKIPANILTIKRTNNVEELAKFYTLADMFINPTLEDNFPTTNIESLACGTPVITYKTGGSPEAVNEKSGVVVEKQDFKELVKVIKQFNKKNYTGCIEQAKKFEKRDQYNKYIELYEKVKK